jgi:hypothetical protein
LPNITHLIITVINYSQIYQICYSPGQLKKLYPHCKIGDILTKKSQSAKFDLALRASAKLMPGLMLRFQSRNRPSVDDALHSTSQVLRQNVGCHFADCQNVNFQLATIQLTTLLTNVGTLT